MTVSQKVTKVKDDTNGTQTFSAQNIFYKIRSPSTLDKMCLSQKDLPSGVITIPAN